MSAANCRSCDVEIFIRHSCPLFTIVYALQCGETFPHNLANLSEIERLSASYPSTEPFHEVCQTLSNRSRRTVERLGWRGSRGLLSASESRIDYEAVGNRECESTTKYLAQGRPSGPASLRTLYPRLNSPSPSPNSLGYLGPYSPEFLPFLSPLPYSTTPYLLICSPGWALNSVTEANGTT